MTKQGTKKALWTRAASLAFVVIGTTSTLAVPAYAVSTDPVAIATVAVSTASVGASPFSADRYAFSQR